MKLRLLLCALLFVSCGASTPSAPAHPSFMADAVPMGPDLWRGTIDGKTCLWYEKHHDLPHHVVAFDCDWDQ